MASIIAYLENYVESTIGLPSDLARFLNTIRVLDERATEVEAALRQTTEQLAAIKPVGTRAAAAENTEYQELVALFKRQEQQLYQFTEEKVTLAHHAADLIQQHQQELDTTLKQFEDEQNAIPAAGAEAFNPFEATYAAGGSRGKGKGLTDQWDSLEPLAAPSLKSRLPSHGPPGHKKRVREDQRTGPLAASVLSQGDDFGGMGGMGGFGGNGGNSNPGSMQAGDVPPMPMYPPLQFMNHERTAGLLDSAQQPQLPGRLLQVADIRPDLQGRQAEMYWPDDNMWYLIEIHAVNASNKTAIIVYRTGEVEELNLSEIANEGHMSLIDM